MSAPLDNRMPDRLVRSCGLVPERLRWLQSLPTTIERLCADWGCSIRPSFQDMEGSCSWVATARMADGSSAVLKVGMPHMEAEDEIEGLLFWNGNPTVRLLRHDRVADAMLLERCVPGTALRQEPPPEQDRVLAGLLRRLWQVPRDPPAFRPLSALTSFWAEETVRAAETWQDRGLVQAGLDLFAELSAASPSDVPLATDLHAGNILRAEREPWLVIDPKPFIGDRCFDATQHLLNCRDRLLEPDRDNFVRHFADLLEVEPDRVRLWLFARAAAEPRDDWRGDPLMSIARIFSPQG